MRAVDSCSSAARSPAVSEAATQVSAAGVADPASCHLGEPRLVDPGGRERLGQPPGLLHPERFQAPDELLFGIGHLERVGGPCDRARRARRRARGRLARPAGACSRSTPDSTKAPTVEPSTSRVSASSALARWAAAAGLFSSWARPADIVPSAASRRAPV